VALAGRNEPCPCGSGLKFKRCCGSTREDARALELRLALELEAEALPALMPNLRPRDEAFELWAADLDDPPEELWNGVLEAGVAAIDPRERERILTAADGDPWRELVHELGDEGRAQALLLRGAVTAALRERRSPGPEFFELLDRVPEAVGNPVALVAVLLNPFDVWGVDQLARVGEVDDLQLIEQGVDVLWDDDVRARLAGLVDSLAAHVPLGRGAELDAALVDACEIIRGEVGPQRELAALLLARAGAFVSAGVY
jgi:hypothetical protein